MLLFFVCLVVQPVCSQNYQRLRQAMVHKQIQARGIVHKPTLEAMRKVERHLFVPKEDRESAYDDSPVPIGYGQTISQPYIVACMTSLIDPKPTDRVLEIGTGSGYQAAILGELVDSVFTIEIIPELARAARQRLHAMGYGNIRVATDDGYDGWPKKAPFDAIVVTAAAEHIPPPLLAQLKEGGKMIIPVGSPFMVQTLILVEKHQGKLTSRNLLAVRFVPLTRKKNTP